MRGKEPLAWRRPFVFDLAHEHCRWARLALSHSSIQASGFAGGRDSDTVESPLKAQPISPFETLKGYPFAIFPFCEAALPFGFSGHL